MDATDALIMKALALGAAESPRRGNSMLTTLDMLRSGQTIPQIAAARSLTVGTIETHVTDGYKEGVCPEAPHLVGLTTAIRDEVCAINASLTGEDVGKLRPIRDRCGHSYALIKLALA